VPENDGKGAFGVLAGEGIGIGMADASVVDLDADLMRLWWCDLDVLDGQVLAGLPRNCRLYPVSLEFLRIVPSMPSF